LANRLVKIVGYKLAITKRGHVFLRLSDEEKLTLFIQYLLSNKILEFMVSDSDKNLAIHTRNNLLNLLYTLKEGMDYEYSQLDFSSLGPVRYVFNYLKYMELIGLVEFNRYPPGFTLTHLGKVVFNILQDKNKELDSKGKVIYLNQLR